MLKSFLRLRNFSGGFCPLFTNASDYSRAKTPSSGSFFTFAPLREIFRLSVADFPR
jgi:hypothetical protein